MHARGVRLLLLAVPIAWLLAGAFSHRWTSEDAFITFRVVDNLWQGHGPVFNPGERVEAYTHPLWLLILTVLAYPTGEIERTALYVGLFLAAAAMALGLSAAIRLQRGQPSLYLPAGALAFAALPPVWDFSTSGLEMSLVLFWIAGSYKLLADVAHESRSPVTAMAWFSLGPLVRPDLAAFVAPFVAAVTFIRWHDVRRNWLGSIAALLAIPVAYQLFRMVYFASLVPNPAFAKEAFQWMPARGLIYGRNFVGTYSFWLPAAALAVVMIACVPRCRRAIVPMAAILGGGLLHAVYVIAIGGDFMHARLLLPATFALTMAAAAVPVTRRPDHAVLRMCIVIIAAWAVVCSLRFRAPAIDDAVAQIADERAFFVRLAGVPHPVVLADYAASGWTFSASRFGTINNSLCIGNVGLLGFSAGSGLRVIDTAGLADPITARLELTGRTRAGHEKHLSPSWCAARIDPSDTTPPVEDARAALGCGELQELMNAITEPGGYRQVWRNLSIAVRTRDLRIPGDPQQARRRFCG